MIKEYNTAQSSYRQPPFLTLSKRKKCHLKRVAGFVFLVLDCPPNQQMKPTPGKNQPTSLERLSQEMDTRHSCLNKSLLFLFVIKPLYYLAVHLITVQFGVSNI